MAESVASARYQVLYATIVGVGPTPALALRDFWRAIEWRCANGIQPSGYQLLPLRRQHSWQRRVQAGPVRSA